MIRDDPKAAVSVLRSVLQALALPAEAQLALYPNEPCKTCVFAELYRKWSSAHRDSEFATAFNQKSRRALEEVQSAATIASYPAWSAAHPCRDDRWLRDSEYFDTLRKAANDALQEFGWPAVSPDLEYLPGTAEHARRLGAVETERKLRQKSARQKGLAKLRYHQRVFNELRIRPAVSTENVAILRRRQVDCGVEFPASIFEWFSLEGVADLFREYTNQDELINDALDEWDKLQSFGSVASIRQGYLMVAVENQGVVAWYAKLNGSDDPPIFHDNGVDAENLTDTDWVACSGAFSDFIYQMVMYGNDGVGLRL